MPRLHARIQEFSPGGGPGQTDQKSSDVLFFSPQLILQKSNGQFQRNLSFFKVPEKVQHFPGGGPTFFQGVSNCLFPIETHILVIFQRGPAPMSPHPPPPFVLTGHMGWSDLLCSGSRMGFRNIL